uniref:RRM domain-containing protein n=1 Tax=Timema bartmani TaxID=61472 RepID=A0A7R9ETM4_9NEOP|nr:unnamed protein product [Timema bartmani]
MTGSNKIVQITNIAPQATRDQMQTLFGYLGKIEDIRLYPTIRDVAVPVQSRICYVKFHDHVCVGVAQHMTNTVFIDRALIVIPYTSGDIPDEQRALEITNQGSLVPGLLPAEPKLPPHVTNHLEGIPPNQVITTHDPRLEANGLPLYPPLPATLDARRIEEIRRTLLVAGIESSVTPQQLIDYFSSAGEVKYVRFCSRDGDMEHYALLEFSDQNSIIASLQMNGSDLNGKSIKVYHSTQGIVKPQAKSNEAAQREIEEAMSRVKEAQNLISAAIDPVIGLLAKEKKRSRSGSRSLLAVQGLLLIMVGGGLVHAEAEEGQDQGQALGVGGDPAGHAPGHEIVGGDPIAENEKSKSKSSHSKSHEKSKDKEKDKDKKDDKKEIKKENSKKEDEVEKKYEDSTAENETTENSHVKEADPEKDKESDKKSKSKEKDSKEKDKSKEKTSRDKSKSSRPKSSSRSPLKSRRRSPSRRISRSPSRKKSRSPSRKKSPGHARRRSTSMSRRRSASRSRKRSRSPRSAHSRPSPPRKRSRSRSKGRKDSDKKKEKSHERDKKDKDTDKDKKREKKESEKDTEKTSKVPRNYDEEEEGFDAPENDEQPKKEGSTGSRSEKGGSNDGDDQADEDMDISTSP